jgi:hypothetical protein
LQLEEIAEVVPIMEDPQIAKAIKKQQMENPDSKIPEKIKKIAREERGAKKKKGGKDKKGKGGGDQDSARNSQKGSDNELEQNDENANDEEKKIDPEDDTVHKKKLKKNVESKDACT